MRARLEWFEGKPRSPKNRPLVGQLLLRGRFISNSELERALAEQRTTNELLGEVLVRLGALEPTDLAAVLSLQEALADPAVGIRLAAGIRERLGALLLRSGQITLRELDEALEEQRGTGERLGDILVRQGLLLPDQLDSALAFQRCQSGEILGEKRLRLGELLVATGQISREQLRGALLRQRRSGRKLGEELLSAGELQPRQLERALSLQKRLVGAALAAALTMGAMTTPRASAAGSRHAFARFAVSATVLAYARVQWARQPSRLQISAADVSRGYVDLPDASVLEVKTNARKGIIFTFNNMAEFVTSIKVIGLGSDVKLGSDGGGVFEDFAYDHIRGRALTLGYRFQLAADTQPGTYIWPIVVSATPI